MWIGRTLSGAMLAATLSSVPVAAQSPIANSAPATLPTVSADYRRGFLDGYRARSLSDRRYVDRPPLRWRQPDSLRPPRSGTAPYWRNRPRPWLPPDVYAERRFRGDGPTGRRWIAPRDVIEATSNGAQQLRSAE